MDNSSKSQSWRDMLPIHPAAELFQPMSESELRELGEDIKKNGLTSSIVLFEGKLLDGRNRLDAIELLRIEYSFLGGTDPAKWHGLYTLPKQRAKSGRRDSGVSLFSHFDGDPYAFVLSANIHRRHLTAEQKRDLIEKLLKAKPEQSDRQIAKQTKASPTWVGKIRKEAEAAGDVSTVDTRTDTKGRQQPRSKPKRAPKPASPSKIDPIGSSSEVPATSVPRLSATAHFLINGISRQLKEAEGKLSPHDCTEVFTRIRALVDPDDIVGETFRLIEKMTPAQRRDFVARLQKGGLIGAFVPQRSAEIPIEQRKTEHTALDEIPDDLSIPVFMQRKPL